MAITRRSFLQTTAVGATALSLPLFRQATPTSAAIDPMAAAEALSMIEATGNLDALYNRMHPDAQAIIPRWAVVAWYRSDFLPLEPEPAIATGVRYVSWTWDVNAKTYDHTAEVSFTQRFGDGTEIEDVVRLVELDGQWHWFFGRSRDFIEEQIERFADDIFPRQTGVVPYDLDTVVHESYQILLNLPLQLERPDPTIAIREAAGAFTTEPPDFAEALYSLSYEVEEVRYVTAVAAAYILKEGTTPGEAIEQMIEEASNGPLFRVLNWNLEPPNDVPFAHYTLLAGEAVGTADYLLWGAGTGETLFMLSAVNGADLEVMAEALTSGR